MVAKLWNSMAEPTAESSLRHPDGRAVATPYDNRSSRERMKAPLVKLCGLDRKGTGKAHFRFSVSGRTIGYCYIRKNACSAFKRLMVDFSEHRHLCPKQGNPIDFLIAHHQEDSLARLAQCDALIFVYRDPIERLTSLFINKFVVRSGNADIFADFRQATGRDPATATYRDFVRLYLSSDPLQLDPHVWPQTAHLHRARYSDAIFIGDLRQRMQELLGADLADEYFQAKTNASVGKHDGSASDLGALSAAVLREAYLKEGVLPTHEQLAGPAMAEEIADIYRDDMALFGTLSRQRARAPGRRP